MANTLQLKNDIKKLKGALASKGLSASIKDKLKTQLSKAENELKAAQGGAAPRKVSTTKSTKTALDNLKALIKKDKYSVYKGAGVDLKKDAQEGALATGRRVSKGLKGNQFGSKKESKGHVYYEYRANRLDVKQPSKSAKYPKLEQGGYMAKGGNVSTKEKLIKELQKLQTQLNSSRLSTYKEGDNSEEEISRQRERKAKLDRFNEILEVLKEYDEKEQNGKMAKGGLTEKEVAESNAEMVLSQTKAIKHHADELSKIVSTKSDVEAWVVAKIERASTDLSDITHYLDGQHEKMSMGGSVYKYTHKMDKR